MRNILIGTIILVIGAIALPFMIYFGFAISTSKIVSISIVLIGFTIQIGSAFLMKAKHDREIAQMNNNHKKKLQSLKGLTPEEAIKILLNS